MTGNPPSSDHFRLRTFGTLTLTASGDTTVLGQHGHHRRRLALLALLAAAGQRGWSRDQLLLYFWPEATQARARHSLEQLLYALRSSLGEQLFAATNPVILNPALISSDVAEFNAALDRDQPEEAVKQYCGPFLDGFYLNDAPDFERWVEEERARLKGRYTTALERLAETADATEDHAAAVRWWRALTESDPVSARSAVGLMRSLMNAGEHAAALQFAEHYESLVALELGTSAGPLVAKLVAEVRAAAGTGLVAQSRASLGPVPPAESPALLPLTVPAMPSAPHASRRPTSVGRGVVLTVAVLTIAVTIIATNGRRGPVSPVATVAVLPFANVTRDPADAVIVDALSEELITALSRIRNLRVSARQSSFVFRESGLGARRIGESLHVANLLEGSIQRSGDRLRVQVRLVDAPTGTTRWSKAYDLVLRDVFAMQSEVASAVARELDAELGSGAAQKLRRGPTRDIAAYELYLRGRDPVHLRSDSGPAVGLRLLEQAVALDSTFAAAYAAIPYMDFARIGRARDAQEARAIQQHAENAARRAIALDPDLPEAHAALAVALVLRFTDLAGAEAALRRALSLGGAPRIRENLSRVLMWSGRHAESLDEAIRAAAEDPLSPTAAADVGEGLCVNRRYAEGLAQLQRVTTLQPPLLRVAGYKAVCYIMQEKWPSAIVAIRGISGDNPWSALLGYAVARSGDSIQALALEREAVDRWHRTGRGAIRVVYIAAGRGDRDKAFQWLERASDDAVAASSLMYPFFGELQRDPRFQRFRRRIGLK